MRKAWRTDRAQGHAAPAQRQGRVGPRDTRQRRAARREEGGKLRPGDKGGEPSREHPGHSLPLQSGTRAGAAADHGEAWPGEGPGAAGPGVARRRPRAPGGGGGGTWAGARRREREGAGGAGPAAPAAPLGPLAHRWPPEAGSASPAVRSRRSRSPRAEFAEEVRVPAGPREAVPAPASTCPGAGGRAAGCPVQASDVGPGPVAGPARPAACGGGRRCWALPRLLRAGFPRPSGTETYCRAGPFVILLATLVAARLVPPLLPFPGRRQEETFCSSPELACFD